MKILTVLACMAAVAIGFLFASRPEERPGIWMAASLVLALVAASFWIAREIRR